MQDLALHPRPIETEEVEIACRDGVVLGGRIWRGTEAGQCGQVIVNPATGVLARYYHRYARFLAARGFDVLTYDYRGIGASRPASLKGCGYLWRDWGEKDFDAAVRLMHERRGQRPLLVVGHSIGGFLPGLAASAPLVNRMLTVGAQYAWCGDYARRRWLSLFWKWHVVMPALTAVHGYFPGRRLGWLEDLPAGVANEWSYRGRHFEASHPARERRSALQRMASVCAPILAVTMTDDEIGTLRAVRRTLGYYTRARRTVVQLHPGDLGFDEVGHFKLFHDRHAPDFWLDTLLWLRDGINPWPGKVVTASP